jgi:hypothetical protein
VYANQRLSFGEEGKAYGGKAKTSNRTGEIPPSGIIRGASENVTLVEMCTHLATERAGMGTLHLSVGASELYPNLNGNGELTDRPDLRSRAPVLDPTERRTEAASVIVRLRASSDPTKSNDFGRRNHYCKGIAVLFLNHQEGLADMGPGGPETVIASRDGVVVSRHIAEHFRATRLGINHYPAAICGTIGRHRRRFRQTEAIEMNGRRPTPIFATHFASEERYLALSGFVSPSGSRVRQTSTRGSLGTVAL